MSRAADEKIVFSFIDPLIENLSRQSEHLREEAAFELRRAGGPRVVEALIGALADPVAKVRAVALDSLSRQSPEHRDRIAEAVLPLLDDPDDTVKLQAAKTIGRLGSSAAVDRLVALLAHEKPECRLYAALALGRTRDARALAPLAALLRKERDKRVRATVLIALGLTGNAKVVPLLLKIGLADEDRRVRASAIEALGRFKFTNEARFRIIDIVRRKCVEEDDNRVKANAVITLHRLGDLDATSHLAGMVKASNKWLRASAAYVCGQIATPEVTDVLLSLVRDPDVDVRLNVVRAMTRIGQPRMIDFLVDYLDDPEETVRRETYLAFERLANPKAAPALNRLLAHRNEVIRFLAAKGARALADPSSLGPLLDAELKERNPEVKELLGRTTESLLAAHPAAAADLFRGRRPKEILRRALDATAAAPPEARRKILEAAAKSSWQEIAQAAQGELENSNT